MKKIITGVLTFVLMALGAVVASPAQAHYAASGAVFSDPYSSQQTIPVRYWDHGAWKLKYVPKGGNFHPSDGSNIFLEYAWIRPGDSMSITAKTYDRTGRVSSTTRVVKFGGSTGLKQTIKPHTHYAITYHNDNKAN